MKMSADDEPGIGSVSGDERNPMLTPVIGQSKDIRTNPTTKKKTYAEAVMLELKDGKELIKE